MEGDSVLWLSSMVVSSPLMKLFMRRELRDLNSTVILRKLSPNTSSVSHIVRILFSEKMLWYDPAVTVALDLTTFPHFNNIKICKQMWSGEHPRSYAYLKKRGKKTITSRSWTFQVVEHYQNVSCVNNMVRTNIKECGKKTEKQAGDELRNGQWK